MSYCIYGYCIYKFTYKCYKMLVFYIKYNSGTFEARNVKTGEKVEGSYSDDSTSSMAFQSGLNSSIREKYFEQCIRSKGWIKSE